MEPPRWRSRWVQPRRAPFDPVDLVEHEDLRQVGRADFRQHLVDLCHAFVAQRVGRVHDVQQQVGIAGFRQGRAERGDQGMRQVAHEADGVGQHRAAAGQVDAAHRGVERGEQLVGGVRLRTRHRVEQRGLAGIGVADQRDARQLAAHARPAHLRALHLHLVQPALQRLQPLLQHAAVELKLRLAGAAQADGAAALALKVGPAAHQARGHVAQLRQFDLQLAFVALRTLGEDVQDQPGAVDHAALQRALQVALLGGRQRVVDQDEVGPGRVRGGLDLLELAAADQRGGIGPVDTRAEYAGDRCAGRARKLGELLQQALVHRAAGMGLDQQRMFALAGSFKEHARASSSCHSASSEPWSPLPSPGCT